jgi:tetratricopeptide (TPR) repeat protein
LLTLDEPEEDINYGTRAKQLADFVPQLIQMTLDEDLNSRKPDDPAVWAPLHALGVLGELGPPEAAEPLIECFDWQDEWFSEKLPDVYAAIGPSAVPVLKEYLDDATRDPLDRGAAARSLLAIAEEYPEISDDIIAYLIEFLDRPTADDSADEEVATTFVIAELTDQGASEAYPAIKRAYDEDRVDTKVIGLEGVKRDFGMLPPLDSDDFTAPRDEPGVRIELRCLACGRERTYVFPEVYCDLGTMDDEEKRKKYDPIIIPQRVTCSKCGAVDQYEISGMGQFMLTADLLTQTIPELGGLRRENQQVKYMEFTALGQKMHPLEALEEYEKRIARQPDADHLYVGYGNVLRFLGRIEEAKVEYRHAVEIEPHNAEAYLNLAQIATEQDNLEEAATFWQRVRETAPQSQLDRRKKKELMDAARYSLRALEIMKQPIQAAPSHQQRPSASKFDDVGRNDPCPCGSGKKYKYCCLRKHRR